MIRISIVRNVSYLLSIACGAALSISIVNPVWAQTQDESFFDKYFPIAKLFDSPYFFATIIGSAVILLTLSLVFIFRVKRMEQAAYEWGKEKSSEDLIDLLCSPVPQETRMAMAYLKKNAGENEIQILVKRLEKQRQQKKINPNLIYMAEDLEASQTIPVLKQIVKENLPIASLASQTLDHILTAVEQEEKEEKEKEKAGEKA